MAVLIHDAGFETRVRAERQASDASRWDEVWDGVLVMPPMPNNEHQMIVVKVCSAFSGLIDWDAGDACLPGANISSRVDDWQYDYRVPDVVVIKAGGLAKDHGTHWVGGPDLVMEVLSDSEEPYAKLDFYAGLRIGEVLILHRDPSRLERFQLTQDGYRPDGHCDAAGGTVTCKTVPVTIQMKRGKDRDQLVIKHAAAAWVI